MEALDFSSHEIIRIPVVGPDKKSYILCEGSGDTVAKYNNARARCAKYKDGGLAGVEGAGDLEMLLVSMCLWNDKGDGTPDPQKPVAYSVLRSWPGSVIHRLFDEAKRITEIDADDDLASLKKQRSELDEKIRQIEEDAAKNEPSPSETGLSLPGNEG